MKKIYIHCRQSKAPIEILKPEEARYQYLEKELLHTVKTEFQQKMKKQSNKVGKGRKNDSSSSVIPRRWSR